MFTEIEYRYFELTPVWAIGEHRPEGAQQIPPVAFAIDPVTTRLHRDPHGGRNGDDFRPLLRQSSRHRDRLYLTRVAPL